MDQALRAPWRAMIRYALFGVGIAAALVLLSLVLGSRPASAATLTTSTQTQQQTPPGGLVRGVGDAVQGVTGGVGHVVESAVAPVRKVVAPPAPSAPVVASPKPAAPAPVASAPAPKPAAPAPSAPTHAVPSSPSSTAPATPAHAAGTTATAPVPTPAAPAAQAGTAAASSASRPVADTLASAVRPVTSTVQSLTAARPVTTVVHSLDQAVGGVPLVGSLLGDDTLGTVTGPVTGLVDDTLGTVGTTVGSVPGVITDVPPVVGGTLPGGAGGVVDVPTGPVLGTSDVRGGSARLPGSASDTAVPTIVSADQAAAGQAPAARGVAHDVSSDAVVGATDVLRPSAVTVDGRALLVPAGQGGNQHTPLDGPGAGVLGGSAAGASGPAAAVGIVGSDDARISLAAGSRGTLSDDAVPASLVGEHDVAPD
ncbi:hypothetical protein ACTJKO_15730 [Curtobacterium sp. 22159]|uniref:hypothetical protein n=1 Tax=Curtobacterium sp. 22159 TaxID=3453882 RepID=UPI003F830599